jgi:hypothetical protein
VIHRHRLSESWPELYEPADLQIVLDAVLGIVVRAWIWIRRKHLLREFHRSNEPRTAGLLYRHMKREERQRQPRWPRMKLKTEVGSFSSDEELIPDGRIDIEIIYSLDDEPDLRLECKRVSASIEDDRAALGRYYVSGGVLRFVGDKYGRGHRWGVLIAFVVDGRFGAAVRLIADYVTRDDPDHLLSGFEAAGRPPRRHLFQTVHRQGGGSQQIRLLHLFLPFPPRSANGGSPPRSAARAPAGHGSPTSTP